MIDLFSLAARAGDGPMHFRYDAVLWDELLSKGAHRHRPDMEGAPGRVKESLSLRVNERTVIYCTRERAMTREDIAARLAELERQAQIAADDAAVYGPTDPWRETAEKDRREGL